MSEPARLAERARRHHYVDAYTRVMLDEMADAIEALVRERDALRGALTEFVERYCAMVNSGDCGFWNPEKEDFVIRARAALTSALGPSSAAKEIADD